MPIWNRIRAVRIRAGDGRTARVFLGLMRSHTRSPVSYGHYRRRACRPASKCNSIRCFTQRRSSERTSRRLLQRHHQRHQRAVKASRRRRMKTRAKGWEAISRTTQIMTLMATDVNCVSEFAWHSFSLIGTVVNDNPRSWNLILL